MKTTKTYLSGCKWCNASGFVNDENSRTTSVLTMPCPVCKGQKTILVTETTEE